MSKDKINDKNGIDMNKNYKWWDASHDRTFKDIFCGEDNKEMLSPIMSTMFEETVEVEEILINELSNINVLDRRKTVDLFAKVSGRFTLVEINNGVKNYIPFRNFVYFASTIAQKTKMGRTYDRNVDHVLINLNYGKKNEPYLKRVYKLQAEDGTTYLDNVIVIDFNMDRIKWEWYNKDRKKVEKYKYLIMLSLSKEELDEFTKGDPYMEEFKERISSLNSNTEFQAFMSAEEESEMFYNTDIKEAREEGHASGLEEGKSIGVEEGRASLIKSLIASGMSIEDISSRINISIEEIESLIHSTTE